MRRIESHLLNSLAFFFIFFVGWSFGCFFFFFSSSSNKAWDRLTQEHFFGQQVTLTRKIKGSIVILYNTFVNEQKFFASGLFIWPAGSSHHLLGYYVHNRRAINNPQKQLTSIKQIKYWCLAWDLGRTELVTKQRNRLPECYIVKKHQKVSSTNYFSVSFPDSTTFFKWMNASSWWLFQPCFRGGNGKDCGWCIKSKEKAV